MSVSVDDLVASLSANHIDQEALDLAALQAQLAQSLLAHQLSLPPSHPHTPAFVHGVSANVARRDPTSVQHCTTPTARTPSSASCTWPLPVLEHTDHDRRRSASYTRQQSIGDGWCDLDEMAEECAVEDMVTADSPSSQNAHLWSSHNGDTHGSATRVVSTSASTPLWASNKTSPAETCPSSLFASTDPFYLQASQPTQQSHTSFFNHVGVPNSCSPFMLGVPAWE